MDKLPFAWIVAGLLLPLSGCQEEVAAPPEATVPGQELPPLPTSFSMVCDCMFLDFTTRTEDVQATLPPGYIAADMLFGTDWVALVAGMCDIAWNNLTWEDVPLAWTQAIVDGAVNATAGLDVYTYEWLAETGRSTEFFDWLSSSGWPVIDATVSQGPAGYEITAPGLAYRVDGPNIGAIPLGLVGFGGDELRFHHGEPVPMAFDVQEEQALVLTEADALLTVEGGALGRLGPLGMSPTSHPVDRFFVLQDWGMTFQLAPPDEDIEPIRT